MTSKLCKSIAEPREGRNRGVLKAEFPMDETRRKVIRQ